jgi:hypothetical protein
VTDINIINLKIGDWVELRNGKRAQIVSLEPIDGNENYPIGVELGVNIFTYTKKGSFIGDRENPLDITKKVEI